MDDIFRMKKTLHFVCSAILSGHPLVLFDNKTMLLRDCNKNQLKYLSFQKFAIIFVSVVDLCMSLKLFIMYSSLLLARPFYLKRIFGYTGCKTSSILNLESNKSTTSGF